jgi:hypothetical protein
LDDCYKTHVMLLSNSVSCGGGVGGSPRQMKKLSHGLMIWATTSSSGCGEQRRGRARRDDGFRRKLHPSASSAVSAHVIVVERSRSDILSRSTAGTVTSFFNGLGEPGMNSPDDSDLRPRPPEPDEHGPELSGTVHDGRMYSIYGARETVGYIVHGQGHSAGGEHLLAVGGVDVALYLRGSLLY